MGWHAVFLCQMHRSQMTRKCKKVNCRQHLALAKKVKPATRAKCNLSIAIHYRHQHHLHYPRPHDKFKRQFLNNNHPNRCSNNSKFKNHQQLRRQFPVHSLTIMVNHFTHTFLLIFVAKLGFPILIGYVGASTTTSASIASEPVTSATAVKAPVTKAGPGRPRKDPTLPKKAKKSKATTASTDSQWAQQNKQLAPFTPIEKYPERDPREQLMMTYEFLTKGIDGEDLDYIRRSYEFLLQDDVNSFWLNATHYVDHCVTDRSLLPPPTKKRKKEDELKRHSSGCARAEGYYKVDISDKMKFKYHHLKSVNDSAMQDVIKSKMVSKMQGASREARSNQRRLLTEFGSTESELLKFNQLKFRKKQLKFAKSAIHDWGLFAMEPIAADEMVIEYVGQMIRPVVADLRETKYEAIGIGSSYLFRIDLETIIDATKCGNLARFINHSCNVCLFFAF